MKGIAKHETNIKPMAGGAAIAVLPVGGYIYGDVGTTDMINFSRYYTSNGARVELGQPCKAWKANLTLTEEAEPAITPDPTPDPVNLDDFDFVRQVREGIPNASGGVDWGAWRYEGVKLMEELP